MTTTVRVIGEVASESLDRLHDSNVVVVACGYESRARAFAAKHSFPHANKYATEFEAAKVLAYSDNRDVLGGLGYERVSLPDSGVRDWLRDILRAKAAQAELSVAIDISSQSRARLASIVEALMVVGEQRSIRAYFAYSIAQFVAPDSFRVPNVSIGPVNAFFAGWASDPDLPLSLVLGLGYEPDRALGAVEHLEPSLVWALLPHSSVARYDTALTKANAQLLDQIGSSQVLRYEVEDPNSTFAMLTALIARLAVDSSVLLLPSGPKLLVVISLISACLRRDVAVWRVSAGVDEGPLDRVATGRETIFECVFEPMAEALRPAKPPVEE